MLIPVPDFFEEIPAEHARAGDFALLRKGRKWRRIIERDLRRVMLDLEDQGTAFASIGESGVIRVCRTSKRLCE